MTGSAGAPDPALAKQRPERVPGVRVVLDARPLQAPERAPLAAAYLDGLLSAFDAAPLAGESFAFLIGSDLDDPTTDYEHLEVIGRRQLPPTRLLRSAAMTVDPFLLRGAAVGSAWRAERGGAAGAVYHAVGGSPLPIASGLPVVATLLDLAAWELPGLFQKSVAGRFGQRLRGQLLRDAAAVIVGSDATARAARRLLHIRRDRLHVVRLAPRSGFGLAAAGRWLPRPRPHCASGSGSPSATSSSPGGSTPASISTRCSGHWRRWPRLDRPIGFDREIGWPPRVLLVGASPDDRASIARAAARKGIGESIAYAPSLPVADLAGLVRGARAAILPVVSEAAGLPVIEALASGTPVIASSVGPLPELVGPAGLLVEPRDPSRLAVALATMWADDGVHDRVAAAARERAETDTRTWADVADETRAVYAAVGRRRAG